ncbi:MAG: hypothetical protein IJV98_00970 [Clostridia bacterium]|nr:hypothetical protein [Clostridia bacterium]
MKRILFLLIAMLFFITSCTGYVPPAVEPYGVGDADASYPITSPFTDAKTRLLYVSSGVMMYYNKLTEEIYPFCFDTLCSHGDYACLSHRFSQADTGAQSVRYCAYDNRFYALRGEQLCSFAFDGSDLRVECSFGEEGDLETDVIAYLFGGLLYLQIRERYVYFLARDSVSGKRVLTRFDVETNRLDRLFHDPDTTVNGYLLCENGIYLNLVGAYAGLYCLPYDGGTPTQISEELYTDFHEGIFDGEEIWFVKVQSSYDEEKHTPRYVYESIVSYHPTADTFREIAVLDSLQKHKLLAVTPEYIYYTVNDPVSVGFYEHDLGGEQIRREVFNYYGKILRLDKASGETLVVLEDLRCEPSSLFFYEDRVFLCGHVCTVSDTAAWRTMGSCTANVDASGLFTGLTVLE